MSRIAALVHFYVNWRAAGSETVLHASLKRLVAEGHEVRAYVSEAPRGAEQMEYEGVTLIPVRSAMHGVTHLQQWMPQVTFTHHQNAVTALQMRARIRSRIVFLTHNDMRVTEIPLKLKPDLVVWNSEWVRESMERRIPAVKTLDSMLMHPPLETKRHQVRGGKRDAITLVNFNANKGAHVLFGLAERFPDRRFIAVTGGHGDQVPVPASLENVEVWLQNPDMKPVWRQTRVVLMPSTYESYGLVGAEAAVSGIPTIAHPTPGLKESLGENGLFADRDNMEQWVRQVEMLDSPVGYKHYSDLAKASAKAKAAQSVADLDRLAEKVQRLSLPGMRVT